MRLTVVTAAAIALVPALMLGGEAQAARLNAVVRPAILSISVSPGRTPATGSPVVITARVRDAATCTFYSQHFPFSSLHAVKTVGCASGHARATVPAVGNPYHSVVYVRYMVRAKSAGGSTERRASVIENAAPNPEGTPNPNPPAPQQLQILSVTASPAVVPASGGVVTITARVTGAVTCTFSGADITALPAACASGAAAMTLTFAANSGPTATHIYSLTATDASGVTTSPTTVTVTQQGAPPPPVVNLDACAAGPDCYYGPIYSTYPDYGNVAPEALGDCTFAAAANWEQIVLNRRADPTVIGYEFAAAGGTASGGLSVAALFSYWETQGIAGVIANVFNRYYTDQADVQNGVRSYGAMLVELQFVQNDGFGQYTVGAGLHMAVVDGFTPEGPLVVSWGQTLQMTWAQWNNEVVGMWGVSAAM